MFHTSIPTHDLQGRNVPHLYDLAHFVAGWERYNLHDLGHFLGWISCTTYHNGRVASRLCDLSHVRRFTVFFSRKIRAKNYKGALGTVGYTGTQCIFGGSTKYTEGSGTGIEVVPNLPICRVPVSGIEFVPNHTGVFGRV